MSRTRLAGAAIILGWWALTAEHMHGGGGGFHGGAARGAPAAHGPTHAPVVIKMHQVTVPRPQRVQNPAHFVHDNRQAVPPARDGAGAVIRSSPVSRPPSGHTAVVRDPGFSRDIGRQQRVEVAPGRYYWHEGRGYRYVHYYDRDRIHWYGFYFGPRFYWCRWWYGRWWWYDPAVANWVFWYDGYWWWQPPGGPVYVYVDNNFYPYDEAAGSVVVKNPEVQPPAAGAPPAGQGAVFKSADGRRMVQVSGDRSEAFLYDNTGSEPTFLRYLGRGVVKARFSGGAGGKPLRILLDFSDGNFAIFDADGQPLDTPESVQTQELPAAPPAAPSPPPGDGAPPANPPAQP